MAVSHPADAFPALLAVAEGERFGGAALLLATAIAYEAQSRFVEVVPYNHHGWDQTPVVALGAALGCGKLLGLDDAQMAHAVSLAVVANIALNQTRTGKLSMWKGTATAYAVRNAVFGVELAVAGMTGPQAPFTGRHGLSDLISAPIELPPFLATDALRKGRLRALLADHPLPEQQVSLLYPVHRHPSSIVRNYLEFCQNAFAQHVEIPGR